MSISRRKAIKVLAGAVPALGVTRADGAGAPPGAQFRYTLSNGAFRVDVDPDNGSLTGIVHPDDPAGMSWVTSAADAPWQPRSSQWGLGWADVGRDVLHRGRWERPEHLEVDPGSATARALYRTGPLRIEVARALAGDTFAERYVFTNAGDSPLRLARRSQARLAIHAPFNDNYTNAADCLEHRAHVHLWCDGSTSWVCSLRMGGRPPHLGWVLTEGDMVGYSVIGRDQATSSNTRGVMLLHPAIDELPTGQTRSVAWTFFWHEGWEDFFAQCARHSARFVRLEASRHTAFVGESIDVTVRARTLEGSRLTVDGRPVALRPEGDLWRATLRAETAGPTACLLTSASGARTGLDLNVCPPLQDLIAARARFIVEHQQVKGEDDPLDGAFLVYDNQLETVVRRDWGSDRNEGRERLGMGVLLARWLRVGPGALPALRAALERYYAFVSKRLQRSDGYVLNGVGDETKRLYNWPWVMQLHVEMARLTKEPEPLHRFVTTVESFYANGGDTFYPIGVPVLEGARTLGAFGLGAEHDHVLGLFVKHGERMIDRGLRYPPSEVNFEQAIVGPAAIFLLELRRTTGDARWLEAAMPHLRCLELFNGRQPSHHLHDLAIRHWDDYWFGKARMWGDTFPHYWSTLTAVAFDHYARITGERGYARRAENIVRNNLSLFSADGRASCAFVYPMSVDGQSAHMYDVYANDQDWALVHALQIGED